MKAKREALIFGGIVDRTRTRRGKVYWVGEVVIFDPKKRVIAHVYGDTLKEMRARKYAVADRLRVLAEEGK